jgi:hypothetical protein
MPISEIFVRVLIFRVQIMGTGSTAKSTSVKALIAEEVSYNVLNIGSEFDIQLLKTPNLMKVFMFIHFAVPVPSGGGRSEKSQAAATGLHSKSMADADTKVKMIKNA